MRAYNTTLSQYVDWVVNDAPDSIGTFSGYPTNQLVNITVNRVVQSKVENFLKPNQSLGGTDGLFFHVNSYDWRNAVTPIPPPTSYTGFQIERGVNFVSNITSASNTAPITITTSSNHNLVTGQIVTINGVSGNVAANGSWPIVVTGLTTFTLTGSVGSGNSVVGGSVFTPRDMSSLIWDELGDIWRFVLNTNGDGTSLGASQSLSVNNLLVDGFLALGSDPADTGIIRIPNNQYIFSESNPSGTDVQLIGADLFNRIKLGSTVTDIVYTPGVVVVDGYVQHDGTSGNIAASTGFIREQNNTTIVAFKNVNQSFSDIAALSSNSFNNIVIGDTVNTGTIHNTASGVFNITAATAASPVQITVSAPTTFVTGQSVTINGITGTIGTDPTNGLNGKTFAIVVLSPTQFTLTGSNGTGLAYTSGGTVTTNNVHSFQVGGTTQVEIGAPFVRFPSGITSPFIYQLPAAPSTSGQNLTIQSQNAGLGGSNGGNLTLTTGTGTTNGIINLQTGGVTRITLSDTTETHIHQIITFANTVANPIITQNTATAAAGTTLTVQAQATSLAASAGGNLALSSGAGTSQSGNVFIQTGGTTQIVVSPLTIAPSDATFGPPTSGTVIIKGNLEVQGAMTTVESTVVDIIGRVIHANWADPIGSPNVARPTQNVGYSIHRGNVGGQPRDGAAWIWTEGALDGGADGYWRAVTIHGDGYGTDNFNITNSISAVGVMGNDFVASSDPAPVLGYIAASGSLRTANNVPVAVSRDITATTTVTAASNLATLPQGTINVVSTAAFTTSGTLLVLSSTGVQTITYTGTTGTSFTGCVGGTGTIITGSIVGQTNNSTTIAAPSNGQILPQGTINVVSTTGFPQAGTLRIYTTTSTGGIQNVSYTGTTATSFTGCTGGTGTLNTGNIVTSIPATGTQDLVLLGTDFGNRILHGAPTSNAGHIFNTTTGSIYDFQINSVSQVQLRGDTDVDTFTKTITIAPTVSNPKIYQIVRPDTGANNGFNMMLHAQDGQQQTGANANNNGGLLILSSGTAGTGGSGAAGTDGYVDIRTGVTTKIRVFPTDAAPPGPSTNDNSILYFENLFRVDTAQLTPLFRQDDTATATGQSYTIQAQNATTTGGALVLTSGTGATTAGDVQIRTGGVDKVIVHPTFTEFRDTAEALRVTPVSAGTTQITYAATVTSAQINQTQTASTPSAPMTIQSQVTTAASGQGGNLILIAGNATGTTSTGGNAILTSGTGTTVAGNTQLQTGGVDRVVVHPTFTEFRDAAEAVRITPVSAGTTQVTFASTVTAVSFNQTATVGATGAPWTIQAQAGASGTGGDISIIAGNATTTGGDAIITSGTGATAGNVQLQTGAVDRVVVHPTFTEFRDTAEALRVTPVSTGTTSVQFASTVLSSRIFQADLTTASGVGATLTVQAQNETGATSTGGSLNLTSGTGTLMDGYTNLQAGGSTVASVHTDKFIFAKGWRRNVSMISSSGTYNVLDMDDYIAVVSLSAAFQINLPASPMIGDTYEVKDTTGNAVTFNITISGNGKNIDGAGTFVLTQAYASAAFTYTGTQWSVT